ncbi:MAG: RsiV family protein [Muribaculaceae bacterium]|nr:RsiV family protein [Muribaculaceae bacterium]
MRNIKMAALTAAVLTGALFTSSCSDGNRTHEGMTFESYSYDGIACLNSDSAYTGEAPIYLRATGRGVIPVSIGEADITVLRDSLQVIAGVDLSQKGTVLLRRTSEYSPVEVVDTLNIETDSFEENELSIVLMTPRVIVWRSFSAGYTAGAAHGRYSTTYLNYSIDDNRILGIYDLLRPNMEAELEELVRGQLKDNRSLLVPVDQIPLPANFEVTADGLNFVYGIYEIAPYAAGEIVVNLDYYALSDLLLPEMLEVLTGRDEKGDATRPKPATTPMNGK